MMKYNDFLLEKWQRTDLANLSKQILIKNGNNPLTDQEMWNEIIKINPSIKKEEDTYRPWLALNNILSRNSINSKRKDKNNKNIFEINYSENPIKFKLHLNVKPTQEPENKSKPPIIYKQNPFGGMPNSQAICVTGESDLGKSSKVIIMLKAIGHKIIEIDIQNTMRGLLVERNLRTKRLDVGDVGYWILEAAKPENKDKLYTFVFDECHYPRKISMINAELFYCLSKKKNRGLRTIKTNRESQKLFSELPFDEDRPNSRIIPDNVGFIFISSQGESLEETPDFSSRVNFANLTEQDFVQKEEELDNPNFPQEFFRKILTPYKKGL